MKVLIAPDKFKGSLTAAQAARAIRRGVERALTAARCRELPIADGGEGAAEVLCGALGGEWITTAAHDGLGRPVEAGYASLPGAVAAINMSEASGLWRLAPGERDPLRASTAGTGELMAHARTRGARTILVGLGGSATNDGGIGMAAALGWRFMDRHGNALPPLPLHLPEVERILPPSQEPLPVVTSMVDVGNPLLGKRGATYVYGPQKGADAAALFFLEAGLTHLADVARRDLGRDYRDVAGAGAAGGLGFGLLAFCGAEIRSGFDTVAGAVGLDAAVAGSDLVITGEGCLDRQTLEGKGPAGVASLARRFGKPVFAFGGAAPEPDVLRWIFDGVFAIKDGTVSTERAMREAETLLEARVAAAFATREIAAIIDASR